MENKRTGDQEINVDQGASGVEKKKVNYPANSHKAKSSITDSSVSEVRAEKKVTKVITGGVVTKKKTFGKKMSELFLSDDVDSVAGYILHDVLIPAAKSTFSDMVNGGLDMMLFGETKGSRTRRDKGKSYVSYNGYYGKTSYNHDSRDRNRLAETSKRRARHNFDDIILETRGEAEEVLSNLVDLTVDYGMASVADLYALVDLESNFTDDKYGWVDLSGAVVTRVRTGYMIDLPRTIALD